MPLVISPGFGSAFIELVGVDGTAPYGTTIGVDLSAAGGDFVAAANAVFDAYADTFLTFTNPTLTLSRVILSVGQDGGGTPTVQSDVDPQDGIADGPFAPTAMSAIMTKVTATLGRKGRGRMFIPGAMAESNVAANGGVATTAQTSYNNAGANFLGKLNVGVLGAPSLPPVLLHSDVTLPTPIISLKCAPLVGWISGRLR